MPTTRPWTHRLTAGFTRHCATSPGRTCQTILHPGETGTAAAEAEKRFLVSRFQFLISRATSHGRLETRNQKLETCLNPYSAIFATCRSNPVFGSSDVSSK